MPCSASRVIRIVAAAVVSAGLLAAGEAGARGRIALAGQQAGPTPFIAFLGASYGGAVPDEVAFEVVPRPGSFTRPIVGVYSASYLGAHGFLGAGSVTVPVFGLYPGQANTVVVAFGFRHGPPVYAVDTVTTAAYSDPCSQVNAPVVQQNRQSTSDLSFDYFLLKDYCSANSPAIFDTDGAQRWAGFSGVGSTPSIVYGNGVYTSDGATGVNRMELYGGITKIGDYAALGVTATNTHNFDFGRDGILIDADTSVQTEATAIEIDAASGAALNVWDMGQIIGAAMVAGGDDPSQFVFAPPTDWFHLNATAYRRADNTLIVSSRENFVIAVDYDVPADGVRKIHWILGDTTKKWYTQFPSLRAYALQLAPGTLPPIGQHALSIDGHGDLLLLDDGLGSMFQRPPGATRSGSVARSYTIDTAAGTATAAFTYAPPDNVQTPAICSSVYAAPYDNHLVALSVLDGGQTLGLTGLGSSNQVVFGMTFPELNLCSVGWNAVPLPGSVIGFQ